MARLTEKSAEKVHTETAPRNRSSRGPLLLASGPELGEIALRRAAMCARAQESELHVLRVLAPFRPDTSRRSPHDPHDSAVRRLLDQSVACHRATLHAYQRVVDVQSPHSRIHVRVGPFVETVERHVARLAPGRVFVPADLPQCGVTATRLVHAIGRPVCVVRGVAIPRRIVATTDLRDPRFPVLREAARLANRRGTHVVAVHSQRRSMDLIHGDARSARARLFDALRSVGLAAEDVVVRAPFAARTILKEARLCGADMVLIGTHATSNERPLQNDVAPIVIDRGRASVLVMPLSEAH